MSDEIKGKQKRYKTLRVCHNKVARNTILALSKEVEIGLAKNVSSAANLTDSRGTQSRKLSHTQLMRFERLCAEQKSQNQITNQAGTDADAEPEILLDGIVDQDLQNRMTKSIDDIEAIETDDKINRRKQTRWMFFLVFIIFIFIVIGTIVAIVIRKAKNSDGEKLDMSAKITKCQGSLGDDLTTEYNSLRFALSSELQDITSIIDTPFSAARCSLCWLANIYGFPLKEAENQTYKLLQRFVIGAIYYSFNGTKTNLVLDQFKNTSWMSDRSVCEWDSVECNDDNEIDKISFSDFILEGTIPSEIALLTSLTTLNFNSCSLAGELPFEIGEMSQLQNLEIVNSELIGTIPDTFSKLLSLKYLVLSRNDLSGTLPNLNRLTQLEDLDLAQNSLLYVPEDSFSSCSNLVSLRVHDFYVKEKRFVLPSLLGAFTMLESLVLQSHDLSGILPTEIGLLTELTKLVLFTSTVTESSGTLPTELGNLSKIQNLIIASSYVGTIPTELGNLSMLRELQLSFRCGTGQLPSELARLTMLHTFFLEFKEGTHATDFRSTEFEEVQSFLSEIQSSTRAANNSILLRRSSI